MLVDLPLLSINKSILTARMPIGLPLYLPMSFLRRNPRVGLMTTHLEVGGLGIESMFNKNIIKLGDNKEYIEEATDAMVILRVKQGCDYKGDIPAHLKISLN